MMAFLRESDVIVVGGGLAGLASATYLARGGASVTVLERAPALGGRAATDTPHGFALNRGIHALYTGGAASEVLRELGVEYTAGRPSDVFALDESGLQPLPTTMLGLLRTSLLSIADKREFAGIVMRLGGINASALASVSAVDWIASTASRPHVKRLLEAFARTYAYCSALDLVSADVFVSRLQQSIRHPIHYIDGGWQTLVGGLRAAAIEVGVQVRTSASVSGIHRTQNGYAVELHDGTGLRGDQLLLALTPDAVARLLPEARLTEHATPVHVACLDLALERLPVPSHPVVIDFEQPRFVSVQSRFARLAPAGGAVVHAFKQLDPRQPAQPHQDRHDLEAFLDVVQPGWRKVVVEHRFLPRILASGALPTVATGGMAGRASYQSDVAPGVYFAGDWVGPRGYLVDASLDSARQAARLILRERSTAGLSADLAA